MPAAAHHRGITNSEFIFICVPASQASGMRAASQESEPFPGSGSGSGSGFVRGLGVREVCFSFG